MTNPANIYKTFNLLTCISLKGGKWKILRKIVKVVASESKLIQLGNQKVSEDSYVEIQQSYNKNQKRV